LAFDSKILSNFTYACGAWWGFTSEGAKNQIEALLRKAGRFNYYSSYKPTFSQLVNKLELNLFFTASLLILITFFSHTL